MSVAEESLAWLGDAAPGLRVVAELWATVDLERAAMDRRRGTAAGADEPVEDPLLGARVFVLPPAGDGRRIALAEPSTEGRLAATLARHGEGRAGSYLEAPAGLDVVRARAAAARVRLSPVAIGPFGRSVLVLGERFAARHVILVEPTAVPSPP